MGKLRFFDLFAGAGGLSLGFSWAGFEPVYALEQDKWAADTYSANHHSVRIDVRDIREVTDQEIQTLASIYTPDLIVGGPPCQGFSHANTANRDAHDPRNSLFHDFVRFANISRPKLCVIENVPGLLRTKMANGAPAIKAIKDAFESIGYIADWNVLNSADFGVPQKRERLFIVAVRNDLVMEQGVLWPVPTHQALEHAEQGSFFSGSSVKFPYVTLWDAISDLPQTPFDAPECRASYATSPANAFQTEMRRISVDTLSNHEPMRHTQRIVERFKSIGYGQSEADVPDHLKPRRRGGHGEISSVVYDQNSRRQHPDMPCNAIVASSHTNFIHPFLHRNFTVREMMRIQSFPDWFVVKGKRAVLSKKLSAKKGYVDDVYLDQRAQIGNAVPPKLAFVIAKAVAETLLSATEGQRHAA